MLLLMLGSRARAVSSLSLPLGCECTLQLVSSFPLLYNGALVCLQRRMHLKFTTENAGGMQAVL